MWNIYFINVYAVSACMYVCMYVMHVCVHACMFACISCVTSFDIAKCRALMQAVH